MFCTSWIFRGFQAPTDPDRGEVNECHPAPGSGGRKLSDWMFSLDWKGLPMAVMEGRNACGQSGVPLWAEDLSQPVAVPEFQISPDHIVEILSKGLVAIRGTEEDRILTPGSPPDGLSLPGPPSRIPGGDVPHMCPIQLKAAGQSLRDMAGISEGDSLIVLFSPREMRGMIGLHLTEDGSFHLVRTV